MKRYVLPVVLVVAVGFCVVGCGDILPSLEQAKQTAVVVKEEAVKTVEVVEQEVAKLPPGDPVREKMENQLAKVKEVVAKADQVIEAADAAIELAKSGTVSPALSSALGAVPYGTYIGLGLSIIVALQRHFAASKTAAALRGVVESWEKVGPPLTAEEKLQARAIQGPETTAMVSQIKKGL